MLTPRQELLLRKVVDGFAETGLPVGSKALAADPDVSAGSSTVRNELAVLEEQGLLAHPHTSAGRVPTDAGYRYYVDELLPRLPTVPPGELRLELVRREVDEAMRHTTEALSQITNLLAIVSAPPIQTTTIRHVEVLALQPQVLMVVIITSTGGVSKRVFTFERAVDPGLADWAAAYLNEQLVGMGLGARMLHSRLADPSLRPTERAFIAELAPAFTELAETAETRSTSTAPRGCCPSTASRTSPSSTRCWRCSSAACRCSACSPPRSTQREHLRAHRRREPDAGAAVAVARRRQLRAAAAQPRHRLGDRPDADGLRAARSAPCARRPRQLSRFVEDLYEELADAARLLRVPRRRPRAPTRPRSRRPSAGWRASCTRTSTRTIRRPRSKFKEAAEAYEVLSDAERRQHYDAYGHEGPRSGGYAPNFEGFLDLRPLLARSSAAAASTRRSAAARDARRRGPGRRHRASPPRSTSPRPRTARRSRSPTTRRARCETCHGNGAEPGTPIVTCPRCQRRGPAAAVQRTASASSCAPRCATTAAATAGSPSSPATPAAASGHGRRARSVAVDVPPGIADGQRIRVTGRGHAGERGGPPGDLSSSCASRRTSASCATATTSSPWSTSPAPLAALGTTIQVPTLDGDVPLEVPAGTQPGETIMLARPRHAAAAAAAAPATCASSSTSPSRAG